MNTLEEMVEELDQHLRLNRKSAEKGLYQEVLPRLVKIFKSFLQDEDVENLEDFEGKYIPIKYGTISLLEQTLTWLHSKDPACNRIKLALIALLEELHGFNDEQIQQALQLSVAGSQESEKDVSSDGNMKPEDIIE